MRGRRASVQTHPLAVYKSTVLRKIPAHPSAMPDIAQPCGAHGVAVGLEHGETSRHQESSLLHFRPHRGLLQGSWWWQRNGFGVDTASTDPPAWLGGGCQ